MRFFIILFISLLLMAIKANADTIQINCPHKADAVSTQIEDHWNQTPMPWYASWAHESLSGHLFIAGIRTYQNVYPRNVDPSLEFLGARYADGRDSGEFQISCIYKIHNQEMMDIGDKLYLRSFVQAQQCHMQSSDTVSCK